MRDFIWMYENAVPSDSCDRLIEKYKDEMTVGLVENHNSKSIRYEPDSRNNRIAFVEDDEFNQHILTAVESANAQCFGFDISTYTFDMQLSRYDEQGKYDWHVDQLYPNDGRAYMRKLTVIVQLTDESEYKGGELQILENIAPKGKGTIILFPSNLSHRVRPVTSGVRHSLAAWVEGPVWR